VRGWARYQARLELQPRAWAAEAPPQSLADSGELLEQFCYWTRKEISRVDLIRSLVTTLENTHWPHKEDTGWNNYDVEVFGNRWSRVQLTSAMEQLTGTNRIFRWRVCAYWSLAAKLAFWTALGFEMLIVGVVARDEPWLWMLLLTIPLFGLFLEQEKRNLHKMVAAVLDGVAREKEMIRLDASEVDGELKPRASAPPVRVPPGRKPAVELSETGDAKVVR
jgi:hypothetical protein